MLKCMNTVENKVTASTERRRGPPRPGALNSPARVRAEIARIYRAARIGEIEPLDGGRLAGILDILLKAIRDDETERRLEAVECRTAHL
jgi:hypothetical protein